MKFYGELLVFIFLLITNGRILFVKHAKRDPLVIIAPLSFLLSILLILAWGVEVFTLYAFVVSILVVLSNFHASFRYREKLFVDHYSGLMKFWSALTIFLSLVGIVGLLLFIPVEKPSEKFDVTESRIKYTGSFRTEFREGNFFQSTNAIANIFQPEEIAFAEKIKLNEEKQTEYANSPIVIFLADKRGETLGYKPFLQLLAAEGYTVCSIDFYSKDCRWFHTIEDLKILRRSAMVVHSLLNNQKFESQREFYTYNTSLEIEAAVSMIREKFGNEKGFFLLTDGMTDTAALDYQKKRPENLMGVYSLSEIKEFKTNGYGFVAQTDPLIAWILKEPRDDDYFITRYAVLKTRQKLKEVTPMLLNDIPETENQEVFENAVGIQE